MSRIPRAQEHLKTGFTAEAVTAARYRAFAAHAERDGRPHLAAHWRRLAEEKDRLAVTQLEAAGQVRGAEVDLGAAVAEESYENEVLYPKMIGEADEETARVFQEVVKAQREHLERLERLRADYQASRGDVPGPPASPPC